MNIGLTFQPDKDSGKGEQGHGDGGPNDQKVSFPILGCYSDYFGKQKI